MTVLVTGASGGLGRLLTARLVAGGVETRVLCREGSARPLAGAAVFRGDLRDPSSLGGAARGVRKVVHLAAVTHSRDSRAYYDVNVRGTEHLLAAIAKEDVELFLHMSTRALGGRGGDYSRSKALAEEAVRAGGVPALILRPAEVCGTGAGDPLLGLARLIAKWPVVPVVGDGTARLAPLHADDVLSCVLAALDRPGLAGNAYTLAGEEIEFDSLVDRIAARLGLRRAKVHIPAAAAKALIRTAGLFGAGPVPDQVDRLLLEKSADSSLARRDLPFSPQGIEGLLGRILGGAAAHGGGT